MTVTDSVYGRGTTRSKFFGPLDYLDSINLCWSVEDYVFADVEQARKNRKGTVTHPVSPYRMAQLLCLSTNDVRNSGCRETMPV